VGLDSLCAEFANTACYTLWNELKQIGKYGVIFQFLTAVCIKIIVLRNVTPSNFVLGKVVVIKQRTRRQIPQNSHLNCKCSDDAEIILQAD
jgi:hypothetical protein